jgi:hypothetical protein
MGRHIARGMFVFAGYAAISFAYFGWRLLPHPGRALVGYNGQSDADTFIWSFAWWPHAILAWTNPFFTHAIYAPTGINLAWVTSVPALALLFAPVTLLFGPSVAFNLAAILLPALGAWAAYALCRYVTASTGASLIGGYLYGFSSYMLAQQFASHLNLTAVFLVPLVPLVVVRYLDGRLTSRGFAWRLGALIAFQAYLSVEVALTMTLAFGLGLMLAYAVVREARPRLRSSLAPTGAAYGLAALLSAPLIYYGLTGFVHATEYASIFSADALSLVVPTQVIGWGGDSFASLTGHFPGDIAERDSYLGLPILLMIILLTLRQFRATATRFLLAAFVLATLLSFGAALYVKGHRVAWLPWSLTSRVPGLADVVASRLALYATLAAVVMVARWISSTRGKVFRSPYVLPTLAVAALVPPFWTAADVHRPQRVAFFSDGTYRHCLTRDSTVLIFPFASWGESMLWQAESGFWFRIAEGDLTHKDQPASFVDDPTVADLLYDFLDPDTWPSMDDLRGLAKRRRVARIVSVAGTNAYPDQAELMSFGPVRATGGVFVSPACGHADLVDSPGPSPP